MEERHSSMNRIKDASSKKRCVQKTLANGGGSTSIDNHGSKAHLRPMFMKHAACNQRGKKCCPAPRPARPVATQLSAPCAQSSLGSPPSARSCRPAPAPRAQSLPRSSPRAHSCRPAPAPRAQSPRSSPRAHSCHTALHASPASPSAPLHDPAPQPCSPLREPVPAPQLHSPTSLLIARANVDYPNRRYDRWLQYIRQSNQSIRSMDSHRIRTVGCCCFSFTFKFGKIKLLAHIEDIFAGSSDFALQLSN
jgi:hypothetical protein